MLLHVQTDHVPARRKRKIVTSAGKHRIVARHLPAPVRGVQCTQVLQRHQPELGSRKPQAQPRQQTAPLKQAAQDRLLAGQPL